MLTKHLSQPSLTLTSIARASGLALLAAMAVAAAEPSSASTVQVPSAGLAMVGSTDISAARRHHQAKHASPRNAYGSYAGGAGGFVPQSSNAGSYGYGYGDNSRNQTW
jgi:hypothetical protein